MIYANAEKSFKEVTIQVFYSNDQCILNRVTPNTSILSRGMNALWMSVGLLRK